MRAKSEYPTRHGDQHAPDGSDPITGIGGLQFNEGTYGPENVGDWLDVSTTGLNPNPTPANAVSSDDAGILFTVGDTRDFVVSAEGQTLFTTSHVPRDAGPDHPAWAFDYNGVLAYLQGGDEIVNTGGGQFVRDTAGGAAVFTVLDGSFTVDASGGTNAGFVQMNVDNYLGVVLGVNNTSYVQVLDSAFQPIFEIHEDATVHIKTGQTIIADL